MDEPVGLPLLQLSLQAGLQLMNFDLWLSACVHTRPSWTCSTFLSSSNRSAREPTWAVAAVLRSRALQWQASSWTTCSATTKRLKCFQVLLWILWKIESCRAVFMSLYYTFLWMSWGNTLFVHCSINADCWETDKSSWRCQHWVSEAKKKL